MTPQSGCMGLDAVPARAYKKNALQFVLQGTVPF